MTMIARAHDFAPVALEDRRPGQRVAVSRFVAEGHEDDAKVLERLSRVFNSWQSTAIAKSRARMSGFSIS
jgi:hypothetical protein